MTRTAGFAAQEMELPINIGRFNALPDSEHDNRAAIELIAELRTGVMIPGGESAEGWEALVVRAAGRLAPCVRELLGRYPEARRFEVAAVTVLDRLVRPHAVRWRRWLAGRGFAESASRRHLVRELDDLQRSLPRVVALLEAVRDRRDLVPDDLFMDVIVTAGGPPTIQAAKALDPLAAEIDDDDETRLVSARRGEGGSHSRPNDVAGLALSGGGIRSATFALGLVQVLSWRGILDQLDYLSTVSGGGYLGAFLSSVGSSATEPAPPAPVDAATPRHVGQESLWRAIFGEPGKKGDTRAIRHLRNHSKYLGEGGVWGRFKVLLLMSLGVATNLIAITPYVLALVVLTWVVRELAGWWEPVGPGGWMAAVADYVPGDSRAAVVAGTLVGLAIAVELLFRPLVLLATRAGAGSRMMVRRWFERGASVLSSVALFAIAVALVPRLFDLYYRLREVEIAMPVVRLDGATWLALLGVLLPLLSGPLATRFGDTRFAGAVFRVVFLASGPLFLLFVYLFIGSQLFGLFGSGEPLEWWRNGQALVLLLFVILWLACVDLNALSPHGHYRDRLAGCYLVRRGKDGFEPAGRLRLSELDGEAPFHLINACVNLPGSRDRDLRGRKGDFFCFSRTSCGSRLTGYVPTGELESWDPGLNLGTAMAVSGAAVSSSMARSGLDHLRFFLTLLNVRLGYWLPNVGRWSPRQRRAARLLGRFGVPGPLVLLREMLGKMKESHAFINLSDGGHIENLGVYELLRRKARYIIAVDGERDRNFDYDALIKLVRYARIDLGAEIDIDLSDLDPDATGLSRRHAALGKITYDDGEIGWLLYVKLSVTGDETLDIRDYRREHPSFPHQSTVDQLFDEEQFEAYRGLGEHVARELFREEVLRYQGPKYRYSSSAAEVHLGAWFEALVRKMRPESDPVFRAESKELRGFEVGISISDSPGFETQTNPATLSICRAIIAAGGTVVLGHDWRPEGVMHAIAAFALSDRMDNTYRGGRAAIVNIYPAADFATPPPEQLPRFIEVGSEQLSELRARLTEASEARICIGGKLDDFTGPIPGVLEEAWRAAVAGQPVLVSGALGGAAGWLADGLLTGTLDPLPVYRAEEARQAGLPESPEALFETILERLETVAQRKKRLGKRDEPGFELLDRREGELHRRLWQTTTVEAARAYILEILDYWVKGRKESGNGDRPVARE